MYNRRRLNRRLSEKGKNIEIQINS
jgi:hypothetical protein